MMVGGASSSFSDLVKIGEHIKNGLKSGRIQGASSSQTSETESLSSSKEEEVNVINAVLEDIEYYYGVPTRPYGPPSFQRSPFSEPHYSKGKTTMFRLQYQQPWIDPHSNQKHNVKDIRINIRANICLKIT